MACRLDEMRKAHGDADQKGSVDHDREGECDREPVDLQGQDMAEVDGDQGLQEIENAEQGQRQTQGARKSAVGQGPLSAELTGTTLRVPCCRNSTIKRNEDG